MSKYRVKHLNINDLVYFVPQKKKFMFFWVTLKDPDTNQDFSFLYADEARIAIAKDMGKEPEPMTRKTLNERQATGRGYRKTKPGNIIDITASQNEDGSYKIN